jgi:hypothetical protein
MYLQREVGGQAGNAASRRVAKTQLSRCHSFVVICDASISVGFPID